MNSYGELINTLPDEGKKLIRIRESTIKKIINAELSITFNEICIRENLLPTYTLNIYIYIYIKNSEIRTHWKETIIYF